MTDRRADLIRGRYEQLGWAVNGFARHCGLSSGTFKSIAEGRIDRCRWQTLMKLFNGLGWDTDRIDDFLAGAEPDDTWAIVNVLSEARITPAVEERIREIVRDELGRQKR